MARTQVQTNILDAMQQVAMQQLKLQNRMTDIVAMWGAESMATLLDADIQEIAGFAHVTVAELAAAKNAMDTINTAIGGYVAGTPAIKLLRIVNNLPD